MVKKKVVKKKAKKKIVTPKDVPLPIPPPMIEMGEASLKETEIPMRMPTLSPTLEPTIEQIETPEPEPVNCAKCGTLTKHTVACNKCGALICITCSGHSPCPRCGV